MKRQEELTLLVDIARMYYEEGVKQSDVAQTFNISRSLVSKYLKRAREEGIVEITIHGEFVYPHRKLVKKLKLKYGLDDVVCVTSQASKSVQRRQTGKAAGQYLMKKIRKESTIGVAAGKTLHEVAATVSRMSSYPDTVFIPLTGGMGTQHTDIQSNVICNLFSQRLQSKKIDLHAPLLTDTEEAKTMVMQQSFVEDVFDKAKDADFAVVGIGGVPAYNDVSEAYLHKTNPNINTENPEIIGDICYNFLDENGKLVDCEWNKRVISLDLESLRSIPLVIGVAEGIEKVNAIHAAIKGNLIDVLVTDSDVAEALLGKE